MLLDTLYYDGKCSLCRSEIIWLERWRDQRLQLVDVHSLQDEDFVQFANAHTNSPLGDIAAPADKITMLKMLYFRTQAGEWIIGLDATVAAWRHSPFGFLLSPLRWPVIKPLADRCYNYWAKKRFCPIVN